MLTQTLTLPDDPEELRSFTARLLAEVKAQAILIEKLRHQLAGHRAHRFGASSETAEQLQLALETSEIAAAAMTARMKLPDIEEKDKPKRRPIPDHIPRMEVELTPGADACADCGGRLRRIGEDVTEELEYVPGRFIVNRIVRPRLTCACCERFVQAPLPTRPIERGRPGPGLLAHVLVSKYADHLPFCDRAGLVKYPASRSLLLSVVGMPPQDADYGEAGGSNLYLVLSATWADTSSSRPPSLLGTPPTHKGRIGYTQFAPKGAVRAAMSCCAVYSCCGEVLR